MPNHGYCKNCWWYKRTKNPGFKVDNGKLYEVIGEGICYMLSGDIRCGIYHYINDNGYCPDYWNREKGNKEYGTLEDWLKNI